ncbi:hypothetical protein CLOM_g11486 [Closterium sp. NIES-68]|nr:hypothetical protein CLOM_g11486 [Closterium sp. NIES-68]
MASAVVTIAAAHSTDAASACLAPATQLSWALLCALQRHSPVATAAASRRFPNTASASPNAAPSNHHVPSGTRQAESAAAGGDSNARRLNTPIGLGPSISLPPRDPRAPASLADAFRGNSKVCSCSGYSQGFHNQSYSQSCYSQSSTTVREDTSAHASSHIPNTCNAKPPLPNLTSSNGSGCILPTTAAVALVSCSTQPAVHLPPGWNTQLPNLAVHFAAFNA